MFEFQILRYEGNEDYEDFIVELDEEELCVQYDSISIPHQGIISLKFKTKDSITGVSFSTDLLSQINTQYIPISNPPLFVDYLCESVKTPRILITNLQNDDSVDDYFTNLSFDLYNKFIDLKKDYKDDTNKLQTAIRSLEFEVLQASNEANIEKYLKEDKIEESEMSEHRNNILKVNMETLVKDLELQRSSLETSLEKESFNVVQLDKLSRIVIKEYENQLCKAESKEVELDASISKLVSKIENGNCARLELEELLTEATRQNYYLQQAVSIEKLKNRARECCENGYGAFKETLRLESENHIQVIVDNYEELYNTIQEKYNTALIEIKAKDKNNTILEHQLQDLESRFNEILSQKKLKINHLKQNLVDLRIDSNENFLKRTQEIADLEQKISFFTNENTNLNLTIEKALESHSLVLEEKERLMAQQRLEFETERNELEQHFLSKCIEDEEKLDNLKSLHTQQKTILEKQLAESAYNHEIETKRLKDCIQEIKADFELQLLRKRNEYEQIILENKEAYLKIENENYQKDGYICNITNENISLENLLSDTKLFVADLNKKLMNEKQVYEKTLEEVHNQILQEKQRNEQLLQEIIDQHMREKMSLEKSLEEKQRNEELLQEIIDQHMREKTSLKKSVEEKLRNEELLQEVIDKHIREHKSFETSLEEKQRNEQLLQETIDKHIREQKSLEKSLEETLGKFDETKKYYEKKLSLEKMNTDESHKLLNHEMNCLKSELKSQEIENESLKNNISLTQTKYSQQLEEFESNKANLLLQFSEYKKESELQISIISKEFENYKRNAETSIGSLESNHQIEINSLTSHINSLKSEIQLSADQRCKESEEFQTKLYSLSTNSEEAKARMEFEHNQTVFTLRSEVLRLTEELTQLNSTLEWNLQTHDEIQQELRKEIVTLKEDSERRETNIIQKHKNSMHNLNVEIENLKAKVESYKKENQGLENKLVKLTEDYQMNEALATKSFSKTRNALEDEVKALQSNLSLKELELQTKEEEYYRFKVLKEDHDRKVKLSHEAAIHELENQVKVSNLHYTDAVQAKKKIEESLVEISNQSEKQITKLRIEYENKRVELEELKKITINKDVFENIKNGFEDKINSMNNIILLLEQKNKKLLEDQNDLKLKFSNLSKSYELQLQTTSIKSNEYDSTLSQKLEKINSLRNKFVLVKNLLLVSTNLSKTYFSQLQDALLNKSELLSQKDNLASHLSLTSESLSSKHEVLSCELIYTKAELSKVSQKYQNLITNFNNNQEIISNFKSEKLNYEAMLSDCMNKLQYVVKECEQHTSAFSELKSKNASLEEAVDFLRSNIKQKSEEIEHLESQLENTKLDKKNSNKELLNILSSSNPSDPETIDKMLAAYLVANNTANNFIRLADGIYSHKNKKVGVCIRNGGLVIRVGGGYMYIDEFLRQYVDENNTDACAGTPRRIDLKKSTNFENIAEECVYDFSNPINGLTSGIHVPKSSNKTPLKRFS